MGETVSEIAFRNANIERMRSEITLLYSEIADFKNKIGEYYWHIFTINGQCDPTIAELFVGIERRVGIIANLEQEVQIIEDGMDKLIQPPVTIELSFVVCGSCGTHNSAAAKFCESCGAELGKETIDMALESRTENVIVCPLCGASLPDDAVFCHTCGARVMI